MTSRYRLRLKQPADTFTNAFPIGNGTLGAMVYGQVGTERLDLNIDTLWSGGPIAAESAGPAAVVPSLRQAIADGDFVQADTLARRIQGPGWTESYQPVGWLDWSYAEHTDRGDGYSRELDLSAAETVTTHLGPNGPVSITSFVSAPDEVIVVSATGAGVGNAALQHPWLRSPHPAVRVEVTESDGEVWMTGTGRAPSHVVPNYVHEEPAVTYDHTPPDADGTVPAGMGFALATLVQRRGSDEVRLLVSLATGFRGHDERPSANMPEISSRARAAVQAAASCTTDDLRDRHREDYRTYYDRVDLDLTGSAAPDDPAVADPAEAELFFHMGRYLLISSSRPGTQAANLQGIWNVDVRPGWSSNYTTNINVEMNYWAAESLGLGDLHQPMFDLVRDLAAAGAITAKRYYGARGATAHHNSDIWRFTTPVAGDPQWANWPSALSWMATHLWDHLDFTPGADEFAAHSALPVYRSAALFTLDMLVPDDQDALVWSPSTSPEHLFVTATGQTAATSQGGGMDQELAREVLQRYLALVERCAEAATDEDRSFVDEARAALSRLRDIQIGSDGQLLEWSQERQPAEPGHRHLSHLYGLYPGTRITEQATPIAFKAAQTALDIRLRNGSGYTGWSQAWVLCLAARLRDPALAEKSIKILLDDLTSDSLLDLHPHADWPGSFIFQIDGNFGAIAGIAELLVQSHEGAVALLKTLPPSWSTGRVAGLRCRGGHRVDLSWTNGQLTTVSLTSGAGGRILLDMPADTPPLTVTGSEGAVTTDPEPGAAPRRRRICWSSPGPGMSFELAPLHPASGDRG